ncbi:phosphoribosylglycinamide formyltransferase 2 [Oleiphilus messinensis]|uniref:Formate-dependent phosphoribosylglycinamide formyltransferase n=1 Tax=Oleiphilus messinensis TaxID=141451 RepID=A0A1Y0IDU1_9GAMM|nr:formate-dependent phosphoribosylglycinamide formyltransferase [Oleiphilus messinensis]ARU57534.1 phosphoribosylglycinamide formyltransferase 2 [Oleiphilus messinensis]
MATIGTPLSVSATKVMLCGAGELGKEVIIELQRLGVEVIAVDRYQHAPGMQVAHRSYVIDMLNSDELRNVIESEKPDFIVPEIEAIATAELVKLENEGYTVVPSARAVHLTMNREGIRCLAAEELGLPTSTYQFAVDVDSFREAVKQIGYPCIVKPIMSSSGKGQSFVRTNEDVDRAWDYAQEGGRAGAGKVIVEGVVEFDYEITLLTVRSVDGARFCAPIGHTQVDGDYQQSWQPQAMTSVALENAQSIAKSVTDALGGYGIFGVELFVKGDEVYFSEVSPRPHDTGLVTLISQELSEFALHARAFLQLPVNTELKEGAYASSVVMAEGVSTSVRFKNIELALQSPGNQIRLFGKPEVNGKRRMGVVLSKGGDVSEAVETAKASAAQVICKTSGQ